MDFAAQAPLQPAPLSQPVIGRDDKLCAMRFIKGKGLRKRFHPQSTGWHKNLYSTDDMPEPTRKIPK
jgi:hypothetical protein